APAPAPAPAPGPGHAPAPRLASPEATITGRAALAKAVVSSGRYLDPRAASAAGYVPDQYCVPNPAGPGALGYPHFNHAYDNSLDPARPAALIYEDDRNGGRRLTALEWVVADRDGLTTTDDDRPTLFGRAFKGPFPGRFKGQPVHYALHVWLWKANPHGMFEVYNPTVRCLPGTTRPKA
ncbi:hypothetical protein, partial [Streptomyces purpureus]